jgi:hypothetical protein
MFIPYLNDRPADGVELPLIFLQIPYFPLDSEISLTTAAVFSG